MPLNSLWGSMKKCPVVPGMRLQSRGRDKMNIDDAMGTQ